MGEDTEGMVTSTSKLRDLVMGITGFDIMESETEFKDIYDIIMGIGEQWDNINDIDKASLLEALAGKRQANALAATLQNIDMLQDAYETAENSAGSAMREQQNYEKGIQYSIDRFKSSIQSMLYDSVGPSPIKGIVDAGNTLVGVLDNILDKTGLLGPALATAMTVFTRRTGMGLLTFDKNTQTFGGALAKGGAITGRIGAGVQGARQQEGLRNTVGGFVGGWGEYSKRIRESRTLNNSFMSKLSSAALAQNIDINDDNAFDNLVQQVRNADDSFKNLDDSTVEYTRNLRKGTTSTAEYAERVQNVVQQNQGFKSSLKSLGGSILSNVVNMGAMMAISAGVELAIHLIQKYTTTAEEALEGTRSMIDSYHNLRDTTNDNIKSVKSIQDEYANLRKGVNAVNNENVSLSDESYERYLTLNKQIADSFPDLIQGYDAQGNAILQFTDKVGNLTTTLNGLSAAYIKAKQDAATSLINGDKEAGTDFQTFLQAYENATTSTQATNSQANYISKLQGKWAQVGHAFDKKKYDIGVDTNYEDAKESLNQWLNDRNTLLDKYNGEASQRQFDTGKQAALAWLAPPAEMLSLPDGSLRENGKDATQTIKDIAGLSHKSQREVVKALKDMEDGDDTAWNEIAKAAQDQFKQDSAQHDEMISAARDYLNAFAQQGDALYKMSEEQQTMVGSILSGLSEDTLDNIYNKNKENIYGSYEDFANQVVTDVKKYSPTIESIQSILADPDNLTSANVNTVINDLNKLNGKIAGLSNTELADIFGAKDAIDTVERFNAKIEKMSNVTDEARGKFAAFTVSDMSLFLDTVTGDVDDATEALERYENAAIAARVAQGEVGDHNLQADIEGSSAYQEASTAMSSDQDHDKSYANIKAMIDAANELYEVGDTGTERFKSIASMLDVFGRTDPENFANSLDTLNRYFKDTENSSEGMTNFLEDLEDHNLATYAADTDTWALSLGNLADAAKEMGIGYEPFLALIDELQAKGFDVAYFDNLQDGYQRVGELQAELSEAQAELTAMQQEGSGATQEEIEAQSQKVDELVNKYNTARDAVLNFQEQAEESMRFEQDVAQSMGTDLLSTARKVREGVGSEDQQQMNKYALISQRNALQQQLKDMKVEFGPAFDINNFGDLKAQIDEINQVLKETFGEEYTIDYNLEGEELEGETAGTVDITADTVVVNGQTDDTKQNEDKEAATKKQEEINKSKANKFSPTGRSLTERQPQTAVTTQRRPNIKKLFKTSPDANKPLEQVIKYKTDDSDMQSQIKNVNEVLKDTFGEEYTIDLNAEDNASDVANTVDSNIRKTPEKWETRMEAKDNASGPAHIAANAIKAIPTFWSSVVKATTSGLGGVQALASAISNVRNKEVYVTAHYSSSGTLHGGGGGKFATGTVKGFAGGTIKAFASGSRISIDEDQEAIVNELGEEAVIRDGVMHVIPGGMQQIHLKKGDIVVNHKQLEELENGEVKSGGGRGRLIGSFARGTLDGINTYASIKKNRTRAGSLASFVNKIASAVAARGSTPRSKGTSTKKSSGGSRRKSSGGGGGSSSSDNANTSAKNSNTKATDENTDALDKLKEQFDNLYDWIEVFIDRTDMWLSRWEKQAEDGTIRWQSRIPISMKRNGSCPVGSIKILSASYYKYIAQANASGLSSEYKTKVQQGRKNEIEVNRY